MIRGMCHNTAIVDTHYQVSEVQSREKLYTKGSKVSSPTRVYYMTAYLFYTKTKGELDNNKTRQYSNQRSTNAQSLRLPNK